MFRLKPAPSRTRQRIDIDTIRETIGYIRDDIAPEPEFGEVVKALNQAIIALEVADPQRKSQKPGIQLLSSRFFAGR